MDGDYLLGLSDDAAPTRAALPTELRSCDQPPCAVDNQGWLGVNLGRDRAGPCPGNRRPVGVDIGHFG